MKVGSRKTAAMPAKKHPTYQSIGGTNRLWSFTIATLALRTASLQKLPAIDSFDKVRLNKGLISTRGIDVLGREV